MYLGVDFGTSFSQIATYHNGNAEELNERGEYGIPSVFFYDSQNGELVGEDALEEAEWNASCLVRNVKMNIGKKFTLDSKEYTAEEIIKAIYKEIIELAIKVGEQRYINFSVDGVVLSHPAKFTMLEVNTLCDLARNCIEINNKPLTILGTIKEPVAAALTYYNDADANIPDGAGILVYDLGGGTCDIALVCKDSNELSKYVVKDSDMLRIGGRDWDNALFDYIVEDIESQYEDSEFILANNENLHKISKEARTAKELLTKKLSSKIRLDLITSDGKIIRYIKEVTRAKFEEITLGLLNKTINKLEEMYNNHHENVDIKEIVLVGGSSNMPQVKASIEERFEGITVRIYHPENAVVCGASIYANKVMEKITELGYDIDSMAPQGAVDSVLQRPANLLMKEHADKSIVSDVLPFSYGIRCRKNCDSNEYVIKNLLVKGSTVPAACDYSDFRAGSDSTSVQVDIYESNCTDPIYICDSGKNETFVASVILDTPNGIAKKDVVICKFAITSLDLIEVDAEDQKGNKIKTTVKLNKNITND